MPEKDDIVVLAVLDELVVAILVLDVEVSVVVMDVVVVVVVLVAVVADGVVVIVAVVAVVVDVAVVVGAKLLQSTTTGPNAVELHVPHPEVTVIPAAPVQSLLRNCISSVALPPLTEFLVDPVFHVPENLS